MKKTIHIATLSLLVCISSVYAKTNKVSPKLTEQWTPVPAVVTAGKIPSDAISLFSGANLDAWLGKNGAAASWKINGDIFTVTPNTGDITTKQNFCDIQLHVEWRSPAKIPGKTSQQLANSGIFIQGRYEVQILDSYKNPTYVNGQAASIYKQSPPLVNATAATGDWNSYDIIFTAPIFNEDKSLTKPAYITVLHNGILVQNHFEIKGATEFRGQPSYKAHQCAPIALQEHGNKVSYRNIWVREL
jgi:hypothetical protein